MMPTLVIAIGNTMRRDDGAAHRVMELLGTRAGVEELALMQLTPELAKEIAEYRVVVFIDADVSAPDLRIAAVDSAPSPSPLTHVSRPSEIVALARTLFGFAGEAYICRIPVSDLSEGEGLSQRTKELTERAAQEIDTLLASGSLREFAHATVY
jgi:hydrogenase maturation protease